MKLPELILSKDDAPGVYIIRCRANNATYCGSSLLLRRRLKLHVSLLRSGRSGANLLQYDWNRFGEDQFEFFGCHKPAADLFRLEESLTLLSDSLDDCGGYNKMLGNRAWSLSSRIKNSEVKLTKQRKFSPLPAHSSNLRLTSAYMRTFCQRSTPFCQSEPWLTNPMAQSAKRSRLQELLIGYSSFSPK
jgi:hypothetical protein